jgi:hypothetical protein
MSVEAIVDVVPAVFADRAQAEAAMAELRALGLRHDDLGVMVPDPAHHHLIDNSTKEALTGVEKGVIFGAPLGALAGIGLVALAVPGVGLLGLGGLLAIGAHAGALWGAIIGSYLGLTAQIHHLEDVEHRYEIPLDATDILVVVRAPDRAAEVCAILQRHGARCVRELTKRTNDGRG